MDSTIKTDNIINRNYVQVEVTDLILMLEAVKYCLLQTNKQFNVYQESADKLVNIIETYGTKEETNVN